MFNVVLLNVLGYSSIISSIREKKVLIRQSIGGLEVDKEYASSLFNVSNSIGD